MNPADLGPWAEATLTAAGLLGLLLPLGLLLLSLAALPPRQVPERAQLGLLGAAAALLGYALLGFGLQWGGVGLVSRWSALQHLTREWEPIRRWGEGWGFLGLRGFFLAGGLAQSQELALFLHQVPMVVTLALLVSLVLAGWISLGALLMGGLLVGGVLYPLAGNWVWGGGWLSQLGATRGLGYGVVDYGGGGLVFGLAGVAALTVMLTAGVRRDPGAEVVEPPAHLPLLGLGGALLAWMGMLPWLALHVQATPDLSLARMGANVVLGGLGGLMAAVGYMWFVIGRPVPVFAARGLVAGGVAVLAGAPFLLPPAALVSGAVAGILVCVVQYLVERWLGLDDGIGAVAVYGAGGLWGLLAVALFASGRWGSGWNQMAPPGYTGATGIGVTGFAAAPGLQSVAQAQLVAQLVGLATLGVVAFLGGWLIYALGRALLPVPGVRERLRFRRPVPGRRPRAASPPASTQEPAPDGQAALFEGAEEAAGQGSGKPRKARQEG